MSLKLTDGVGCTLSSDINGYSLQRLVAKMESVVAIGGDGGRRGGGGRKTTDQKRKLPPYLSKATPN